MGARGVIKGAQNESFIIDMLEIDLESRDALRAAIWKWLSAEPGILHIYSCSPD